MLWLFILKLPEKKAVILELHNELLLSRGPKYGDLQRKTFNLFISLCATESWFCMPMPAIKGKCTKNTFKGDSYFPTYIC